MSYLVTKVIKGIPYLYLYHSERVEGVHKVVFEAYLGRADTPLSAVARAKLGSTIQPIVKPTRAKLGSTIQPIVKPTRAKLGSTIRGWFKGGADIR